MSVDSETATKGGEVERFLDDPVEFFDSSYTQMHSIPRERLDDLQRDALAARFAEGRRRIPMVAKLAERQGIESITEIEDAVPMLFEHTMYKSYPLALLEHQRFELLTGWLSKLTAVDLGGVEAAGCDSIDAWLDALVAGSQVDVAYSSGTSGTMTFFPWSRRDLDARGRSHRVTDLQAFGDPPGRESLEDPVHFVGAASRHRGRHYNAEAITLGQADHIHLSTAAWPSADLLWLAARIRLAAVRGDISRVQVPERLLARRAELEQNAAANEAHKEEWLREIEGIQGDRILWLIYVHELYEIAKSRLERGERWSFAPGSTVMMAGGTKGKDLADDWSETLERFLDLRITQGYGMTELSCVHIMCEHGRYHVQPWVIPMVLDEETSRQLPREGVQEGRCAFFDLLPKDHWGGVMTGDRVSIDYESRCSCGAGSVHMAPDISRLGDERGGSDKITCAATPEAHAEAMEFLIGF